MTLTALVTEEVIRRQAATADDLLPLFPGCSLERVVKALEWARRKGDLHRAGRVRRAAGRPATLYAPGPEPEKAPQAVKRVPTSVWDLGLA